MGRDRRFVTSPNGQPFELSPRARDGLQTLLDANHSAVDCRASAADFAVEIDELAQMGLDKCDLRWLVRKGYVQHFVPITAPLKVDVDLLPCSSLRFCPQSCFCLTAAGVEFAHAFLSKHARIIRNTGCFAASTSQDDRPATPVWDPTRRTLSFNDTIIRRFTGRNSKQVQIVIAFHEQAFAASIDDPLKPSDGVDPKDRLYKAALRLSKSLRPPLIRFECDTNHSTVSWHAVTPPPPPRRRDNKSEVIVTGRVTNLPALLASHRFLILRD